MGDLKNLRLRTALNFKNLTDPRFFVTLGAEGVLPGRYIESLLRVFKQFTHTLPSG